MNIHRFYAMAKSTFRNKWVRLTGCVAVTVVIVAVVLASHAIYRTRGRVMIEFDIHQNMDSILMSNFGEPPQFAIWLEDPISGRLKTVFVTYRSATGDWEGKLECPAALPRWFNVYQQENETTTLPRLNNPAPLAVTGATPKVEHFKIRTEIEPGSQWICWIEVNLAGDFNAEFQQYNEEQGSTDIHFSGQPPLVYRGEINALVGETIEPALYGHAISDGSQIGPITSGITTAKDIFKSIKIRVIKVTPTLFEISL